MRALIIVLSGLLFSLSCSPSIESKTYVIGFSQCFSEDAWRKQLQEDMSRQAALLPDIKLVIKDGEGSTAKQIQDIKDLQNEGIDLLVVSPNESEPLTSLVNAVFHSGIPVIIVDRKIENDSYSAYIGADNISVGRIAGELASALIQDETLNIAEVWGLMGSSPARERHQGFISYLNATNLDYQLLQLHGDWTGASITNAIIEDVLAFNPDVIYAHNDFMAAELARKLSALNVFIPIIGTDGLSGPGGGMELVKNETLASTILYPTGGNEAIRIAYDILKGENYIKSNLLEAIAINTKNVNLLLAQQNKTKQLQTIISQQSSAILEGEKILKGQRKRFYLLSSLIAVIALTTIRLIVILWRNKKINYQLAIQNQRLEEQSGKLALLSESQKLATDEKLRFFTNISHELKTPLSLIKVPIEEVLRYSKDPSVKKELNLALKSTRRLSSLVDDLLDFRKIESKGVRIRTYDVHLKEYFEIFHKEFLNAAKRLTIEFTFTDELKLDSAIFDPEAMDKIVTNLLSNAFKFTPQNGSVQLEILNSSNNLIIRVVDSGTGIQEQHLPYIFDRYYQGNSALFPGSGLGLALTKELVELHNGIIDIETEIGVGTIFTVKIPLVKFEDDRVMYVGGVPNNYLQKRILPLNEAIASITPRAERDINETSPTVVLIEDDSDFGSYIEGKLSPNYNTLWFKDGKSALNHLKKERVDIIITDVMLPGMNGIEIIDELKNLELSKDTPIIVASALSNEQIRIDAKNYGAQEFLNKPFSIELLESSITSLVKRTTEKSHDNEQDLKYRISTIIEKNYSNPHFGTGDLASELGISRVQLYRKTKDLFKESIGAVINSTRLSKAYDLIVSSNLNMSEIADNCGFSNASYFSKSVKSRYGFTPNQIRQQARQ